MAIITILGAGRMGTAVTWPLRENGHEVRLVGTHLDAQIIQACREQRFHPGLHRHIPDGVQPVPFEQLGAALDGADVIVSGVNSLGVHWIGRTLAPLLWPGAVILSLTKGVEAVGDALHILPSVLAAELPEPLREQVNINAVAGPVLAYELSGGRHGDRISATVFTGRDPAVLRWLAKIFDCDYYRVWCSIDVLGVEVFAALKNAYVVGIGAARGMLEAAGGPDAIGAHFHNTAALLFAAAARELSQIVAIVGGRPASFAGLQGAGDLYVTATGGRTFRLGWLLGAGLTYSQAQAQMHEDTLEGAFAIFEMAKLLPVWEAHGVISHSDLPMLRAIIRSLTTDTPLELPWRDLMGVGEVFV